MTPDFDSVLATLTDIMRRVFGNPDMAVDAHATSRTLEGWDSFKYVEIIVALEAEFGIALDGPEIDDVRDVGDLARLVEAKVRLGRCQ